MNNLKPTIYLSNEIGVINFDVSLVNNIIDENETFFKISVDSKGLNWVTSTLSSRELELKVRNYTDFINAQEDFVRTLNRSLVMKDISSKKELSETVQSIVRQIVGAVLDYGNSTDGINTVENAEVLLNLLNAGYIFEKHMCDANGELSNYSIDMIVSDLIAL